MSKNHGNNKEVQENNKEIIEATVAPEETKAEDAAKDDKDNNAGEVTPPKDNKDDKEPKKESLIKRAATKVKGGVSKVLNYKFSIGQVLAVTAGVATAVIVGKSLYEKGQRDAIEMGGDDIDDDGEKLLEVHEESYPDEGGEDVYDVEETEAEEAEVSEDGEDESFDEDDAAYEDMIEE